MEDNPENILDNFRREWKEELAAVTQSKDGNVSSLNFEKLRVIDDEDSESRKEEEATKLFLEGVKHEESGRLVEAIRFYKRAMQLVPDVEQRVYSTCRIKAKDEERLVVAEELLSSDSEESRVNSEDEDSERLGDRDLLTKFKHIIARDGLICYPRVEQQSVHISALPTELLVYLLKWVVSADLDLASLEQLSLVCRGFYVCCRDPELWKLVCAKVWGKELNLPQRYGYRTWREMYIGRPRLHFNGCYISKTSYVRPGEHSFQDANYQPWHMVTYFRYIRFFPDGLALMLTTADEPNTTVAHLKRRGASAKYSSVLRGHYILRDEGVHLLFKRKPAPPAIVHSKYRRKRDTNNNDRLVVEQIFEIDVEIKPHKSRLHWTLHWNEYKIRTVYLNKEENVTTYDINPARFPPLWFSRVRSYTAESESPLGL